MAASLLASAKTQNGASDRKRILAPAIGILGNVLSTKIFVMANMMHQSDLRLQGLGQKLPIQKRAFNKGRNTGELKTKHTILSQSRIHKHDKHDKHKIQAKPCAAKACGVIGCVIG